MKTQATSRDNEVKKIITAWIETQGGMVSHSRRNPRKRKPSISFYLLRSFEYQGQKVHEVQTEFDADSIAIVYVQRRLKADRLHEVDHILGIEYMDE